MVDVEGGKGKWRGLFGLHCAIDEDVLVDSTLRGAVQILLGMS